MMSYSFSRNASGGPARRMMSSAGKTDSAVCVPIKTPEVCWPISRRFTRTTGRAGNLLYDILVVRPSHPASIDVLLSLVPKRQSMRLRRRSKPQFRIAQLYFRKKKKKRGLDSSKEYRISHETYTSDLRLFAASCRQSVRYSSTLLLKDELLNMSLRQFSA